MNAAASAALEQSSQPDEEDLRRIFATASRGKELVTFKEATSLNGVEGVVEEGATTLDELEIIWGDAEEPLDFDGFADWYCEVLSIYDDFLWKDAVAPPDDLLAEDVEEEDTYDEDKEYTDEELLDDESAVGQTIKGLTEERQKTVEESAKAGVGMRSLDPPPPAAPAAAPAGEGRQNVEVTRLFREGCDDDNQLAFEDFVEISEIKDLLDEGEITEKELRTMFEEFPSKNGSIDVLAFRDLLKRVDDLFEFVDEEEVALEQQAAEEDQRLASTREPARVRAELLALIASLKASEGKACGLGGADETDPGIIKLTAELEDLWRDEVGDLMSFDTSPLVGDWELLYSTSQKYRRWENVMNPGQGYVKKGKVDSLLQSFTVDEGLTKEYDMEEVFTNDEGKFLSVRGLGSWRMNVQANVVTGEDDLVMKLAIQRAEYDTEEDQVLQAPKKLLESQMLRTFCYSFLGYVDEEIRVMRTGLSGQAVFVFQRLPEE